MNSSSDYIQGFSADAREILPERAGELFFRSFPGAIECFRGELLGTGCLFGVSKKGLAAITPFVGKTFPDFLEGLPLFPFLEEANRAVSGGGGFAGQIDHDRWSPFLKKVLGIVATIPMGETRTYGEISSIMQMQGGARAVGRALAANPLPLLFPCHRVVRSSGKGSGGYTLMGKQEPELKELLLEKERSMRWAGPLWDNTCQGRTVSPRIEKSRPVQP